MLLDVQENDLQAAENDSVVSPISPLAPISPISDVEVGNDMAMDKDAANIEPEAEEGKQEEVSGEVHEASSPGEDPLNQDNSNDLNKEITVDALNEVPEKQEIDKVDKIEAFSREKNKQFSPQFHEDNRTSETVEPLDNDSGKKDIQSTKNDSGNLEESDLLNITEISDFSVDLTGDEAAIVEDILQNSGDGDLLHGGSVEEKLAIDDQEEISGK